jgi:hypothetical protein
MLEGQNSKRLPKKKKKSCGKKVGIAPMQYLLGSHSVCLHHFFFWLNEGSVIQGRKVFSVH